MTTDITELAQSEINDALAQLKQISEYPTPSTQYARVLRKYILALVEALEKSEKTSEARLEAIDITHKRAARERDRANAAEEALEKAQQERDNWRTTFDNERFRADKLKAHIDEMTEERTASINELSRIIQKEVKAKREAEQRITVLESRTVKLPDDEDGQAYGFGKWANGKLPATSGTMTIAYCEDAWRSAFEVFSSAAGIKVEAE
ncbi:hypothetical protein ACXDTE_001002 [Klebsiella pneumoniae]